MGELELITDERIQATAKARHITKSSLDNLVARIKGNDAALRGDGMVVEDPVLILRAMRIVSGREKPWAAAVKAMLSGDLPIAVERSRQGRLMGRVSIPAERVHMLLNMTFDANAHPSFASTVASTAETPRISSTSIPRPSVGRWRKDRRRFQSTVLMTGPPSSTSRPT